MAFGKLYTKVEGGVSPPLLSLPSPAPARRLGSSLSSHLLQGSARETGIRAVAKANNLALDIVKVEISAPTKEFLALNPLRKVPVFVGSDGYVLTESIAIAIYGACRYSSPNPPSPP